MANSYIGIDEPVTIDKKADTEQLVVGANTVERERVQVSGATDVGIAAVVNAAPSTEYGLVTRNIPSGTQGTNPTGETAGVGVGAAADAEATVNGSVIAILKRLRTLLAGGLPAALVGGRLDVNVGNTPVLGAGANNIGDVDVLTLPVGTVAGSASLPAGANNIGDVDVLTLPSLPASHTRNEAFTEAMAIGGELDDTTPVAATEGNVSPARITAQRALHANLRANDGTEIGTAGSPVRTDPTGTTIQPVSGTVTANLAAGVNNIGDVDVLTLPAGTVAGSASLPAGANNIGDVDVLTLPNVTLAAGTNTNEVVGDAAHDAAVAGNPILNGAYAETPDDTVPGNQVSAEGDVVRLAADRDGAVYTHPHPARIWHVSAEYTTAQTDASVKAAPGVGLSLYITNIYLACNAAVNVTLEEGTTTLKWKYYASGQGDGVALNLSVPIKLTANTALTVTTSGAVTLTLVVTGYTAP